MTNDMSGALARLNRDRALYANLLEVLRRGSARVCRAGERGILLYDEASGLYLSGHPLDAYRSQIAQVSTCTIAQLLGEDAKQFDNQNVTLVCTIVRNKIMTTKSNTLMAFTTVDRKSVV